MTYEEVADFAKEVFGDNKNLHRLALDRVLTQYTGSGATVVVRDFYQGEKHLWSVESLTVHYNDAEVCDRTNEVLWAEHA